MRYWILTLLVATAWGSSGLRIQASHTTESLRGVSVVSRQIAWASGTHGIYLRTTDGGRTWTMAHVPEAETLDFRGVMAFSADEAFLMSSGPGELSRIYHTSDGGKHWELQFRNTNPKGFFDSIAFWDPKHGVALGDPVPDDSGKLKFEVLLTEDGESWRAIPPERLPEALEGEGAFAASNTCIALVSRAFDANIWFATGGKSARVFHSGDRGQSWEVAGTPIVHGASSTGIFSIAFRDARHGVIAGGDYKNRRQDGPNLAFTEDGGKTWKLAEVRPQLYFSAAVYEWSGRVFVVADDAVLEIRPGKKAQRLSGPPGLHLNAVSAYPAGGTLVVGANGAIAFVE